MGKVITSLQGLSPYPVPNASIESMAAVRGLDLNADFSPEVASSKAYRLTTADYYMWLVVAPSISQGGISYSFSATEKRLFLQKAKAIYEELDEDSLDALGVATYGYKGSSL